MRCSTSLFAQVRFCNRYVCGRIDHADSRLSTRLPAGFAAVSLQQGENCGLVCTSDEGAVIRWSLTQTDSGKAASIECSTPGGTTVSLTANGQVQLGRTCAVKCPLLGFTVCAMYMCDPLQVIMALTQPDAQAIPSGRGVAIHGAPLPDSNIEAKMKDSTATWRSVLSTGELAQAYK